MAKTCFFCKPNNQYICDDEHCGGCAAGQDPHGDGKPSERMYDGRSWIPGDVSAEALAEAEVSAEETDSKPSEDTKPSERMMQNADDTQE